MFVCSHCQVSVQGPDPICPLCQQPLQGQPDETLPPFPVLLSQKTLGRLFLRFLALLSLAGVGVCLIANYLLSKSLTWSLFVLGGLACSWIFLGVCLWKKGHMLKTLTWSFFLLSVLTLLWDLATGWRSWSLGFVFPCGCVAALFTVVVLVRLMRLSRWDYLIYLIILALFGLLPILFVALDLVQVVLPGLLCAAICALCLVALLLFEGKDFWMELRRKLHF